LSEGLHVLHIRVKDADNTWSLYKRSYFYTHTSNANVTATPIIAAEYFFDTDPGVGSATSVAVTQGFNIDEDLVIQVPNAMVDGDHYLFLRVQNQDNTWSLYKRALFTVDGSLSLEEFNSDSFKIFPNPANEILNINANYPIDKIQLYSVLGKKVLQITNSSSIDVGQLSPGIYIVKIESNNTFISKRLMIQ